jgi:hypothetical protein
MKTPSSSEDANRSFKQALGKALSVSRAELEKRLDEAPKEKEERHKRFSFRPAKALSSR